MALPFASIVSTPGSGGGSLYDFKENERLKLIVIEIGHTYAYEKLKKEEQKKRDEQCDAFGETLEPLPLSFKEGGIRVKCVVLARGNSADNAILTPICTANTPKENMIIVSFEMPTPFVIKNKSRWQYQRGFDTDKIRNGSPMYVNILPAINETTAILPSGKVPVSKLTSADKETDEGKDALMKEADRVAEWEAVLSLWNQLSEKEAENFLKHLFAAYAGIIHKSEIGEFKTIQPEVGVVWEVGVNGPNYVAPKPCRYENKTNILNLSFSVSNEVSKAKTLREKLVEFEEEEMMEAEKW